MNIKITHKAIILVMLPVLSGLVFFGMLFLCLEQAEASARQSERAANIYRLATDINTTLLDSAKYLIKFRVIANTDFLADYVNEVSRVNTIFAELETIATSSRDRAELQSYKQLCQLMIARMNKCKQLIELGDSRDAEVEAKEIRDLALSAEHRFRQLVAPYQSDGLEVLSAQERFRNNVKVICFAGMGFQFVLALVLAAFFNRGFLRQLQVILTNMVAFQRGQSLLPALSGKDELSRLDSFFHDMADSITEATERIKRSEEKVRSVIENLPLGVFVLAQDGTIGMVNAQARQLLRDAEFIDGIKLQSLLRDQPDGETLSTDDLLGDTATRQKEAFLVLSDVVTPVAFTSTTLSEPDGSYVLLGMLDISDRHALEQMRKELVAMVSHDLRSPLTSMQITATFAVEALKNTVDEKWMERFVNMEGSCRRLIGLVNDLLDLERSNEAKLELDLCPAKLDEVFHESVEALRDLASSSSVTLTAVATPVEAVLDKRRIQQVLINLLSNAIKFSPPSSTVEVSAIEMDRWVEVRVSDQGRGIPKDKLTMVFERFKQVDREDATHKGGTGLGLPICKAIVESHGGTIGVNSEDGHGSTFWFRLPGYSQEL